MTRGYPRKQGNKKQFCFKISTLTQKQKISNWASQKPEMWSEKPKKNQNCKEKDCRWLLSDTEKARKTRFWRHLPFQFHQHWSLRTHSCYVNRQQASLWYPSKQHTPSQWVLPPSDAFTIKREKDSPPLLPTAFSFSHSSTQTHRHRVTQQSIPRRTICLFYFFFIPAIL